MKKSILIFGAGINQLELIKEGNLLGIETIVIDPSVNPPGKEFASHYYQVEGNDYDTTKAIALKHDVNGIVTGQMEKPMRLMAKLAKEMGYIFHSPEVVETSLNKVLMKNAFNRFNIPCAKGVVFTNSEKITADKLKEYNYPLIIKPADAFSSKGVMKAFSFDELKKYEEETRSFSSTATIIVEEFLEGKELSVESITYKGVTTVIQLTEKFITPYPNTVELAHLQPARISIEERDEIELLVKKSIRAIGIDNSASHAEVMITDNGSKMIEIGARLGGDFISSYLTKASTGVSMDKAAVQVALGIAPTLLKTISKISLIKYFQLEQNKVVADIDENFYGVVFPNLYFHKLFINIGQKVKHIKSSSDRNGCIIINGSSYDDVFVKADQYINHLIGMVTVK
ncbi:MAG: ATP-grasp domain-containing protein [Bacteroidales bacterium]|jgi:carbamoyl-phosphate synthase large subunit|nr:ATP-grasp domain-containing protein [Bacteroidales bacterium]